MGTIFKNGVAYGAGGDNIDDTQVSAETTWSSEKIKEDFPFKLGITEDGQYGYYKDGADTVTPFKNGGSSYDTALDALEDLGDTSYYYVHLDDSWEERWVGYHQVDDIVTVSLISEEPLDLYFEYSSDEQAIQITGVADRGSDRHIDYYYYGRIYTYQIRDNIPIGDIYSSDELGSYIENENLEVLDYIEQDTLADSLVRGEMYDYLELQRAYVNEDENKILFTAGGDIEKIILKEGSSGRYSPYTQFSQITMDLSILFSELEYAGYTVTKNE